MCQDSTEGQKGRGRERRKGKLKSVLDERGKATPIYNYLS